jgi:glutaryl-CoA dehydrogenase
MSDSTTNTSDVLALDSLLTADELALREKVRDFTAQRIRPNIARWYEDAVFPREIAPELGELGVLGMHLEGYGCPGRSAVDYGLAAMELEAGDSGIRTFVSVQGSLAMTAIHMWGSEAQKEQWLPRMAAGELIGCFALTEPTAGSDPSSMTTFARETDDGWVVNGAKRWIGLASIADVMVVWAGTDDGIRGFLVPAGTPGVTATPIEPKLSMRASVQCDVTFDGVRLAPDAILPGAMGLRGPFSCLNEARYGIAWGAMGAARDSYEAALDYAANRLQFGRPLAGYQLTQEKLVNMLVEIQKGTMLALASGPFEGRRTPSAAADLLGEAEQRPRGHQDRPGGPHHPRRERRHAGLLTPAACQQPGIRADLRGHGRGTHPDPGPTHHRHRGVPRLTHPSR